MDNPVILPPGRARLVTSPLVTGSATGKTMGRGPGRLLGGQGGDCGLGHEDINLERNQFGRESGEPLGLPLGISVFDHDVAALDVTEVTQSLTEGLVQVGVSGRVERQVAYSRDLACLPRLGGERRGEQAASRCEDECPTVDHSITSSARCRSNWEIVRPRALAVLRLRTNSVRQPVTRARIGERSDCPRPRPWTRP